MISTAHDALQGNPVTIRFLDPPLHEFVPKTEEDIKKFADTQGKSVEDIKAIIEGLKEFNPMIIIVDAVLLLHILKLQLCRQRQLSVPPLM